MVFWITHPMVFWIAHPIQVKCEGAVPITYGTAPLVYLSGFRANYSSSVFSAITSSAICGGSC